MLKTFVLAMRFLWRDARQSQWTVIVLSLLLAITATTAINVYTERLLLGLDQQSATFIGGNLVLESPTPIPKIWHDQARQFSLSTAEVWSYPSVVSHENEMQLVNVQAVSDSYPLLGDKSTKPSLRSVWADPRLLQMPGFNLQQKINLGSSEFVLTNTIPQNTALSSGFNFAPRILVNLADIPATKTVIPGSRVDYRLLIAGTKPNIENYVNWIKPTLSAGQRIIQPQNQFFTLRNIIERTQNFVQLILLVCIVMGGISITISIQEYIRQHLAYVALWRALGANKNQIVAIFLWQLFLVGILAGALGVLFGYLTQLFFVKLFSDIFNFSLPLASSRSAFIGFTTALFLLITFAYSLISELPNTSPIYIWRNELDPTRKNNVFFIIAIISFVAFISYFMNFSLMSLFFVDAILLSAGFLYALSILFIRVVKHAANYTEGSLRRGLKQLTQYPASVSVQITGFTLLIVVLTVLGLARAQLLENWRHSLPEKSANYFVINIAPEDTVGFKTYFNDKGINLTNLYPVIRGRLVELNRKPIMSVVRPEAQNHNTLHRELNLSWMDAFPSDNEIVAGHSFDTHINNELSIESEMAQTLGIKLGDQLGFQIGDQTISGIVTSVRRVVWSSFHPNFYIIFAPGTLKNLPSTYISSFYLDPKQSNILIDLVKKYPNITVIDVAEILSQIQTLMDKITLAIQFLFLFALGAGLLIFFTSLKASMEERKQTYYLLRVLGAGNTFIRNSIMVEFIALALVISISSYVLSKVIMYFLTQYLIAL